MNLIRLYIILYVLLIVLAGCTRYIPQPYQVNNTIYSTTIVQNHTIEYINITNNITTAQDCACNTTNTSTKYILGLIQQIKRCEDSVVRKWNLTECVWEMEKINRSLAQCNDSLEEIRELLE